MGNRGFEIAKGWEGHELILPERSTKSSAGYDFRSAVDIEIPSFMSWYHLFLTQKVYGGEVADKYKLKPILVPTGIKAYMPETDMLLLFNRSSNPMKHMLILTNGVGVVDADYYGNPDNDGHIMFQFINMAPVPIIIKKGGKIGQGVFVTYHKVDNDYSIDERLGGMGSTD